jgi:mRNA interferase RelE/StbE
VHNVILHKDAQKVYLRAGADLQKKIAEAIDAIAANPFHHAHIKRLKGSLSHLHRYRLGDYRIVYEIHSEENLVRVVAIAPRGGAYK